MNLLEHRLKKQGINPGLKQGWNEQQFCIDQNLSDTYLPEDLKNGCFLKENREGVLVPSPDSDKGAAIEQDIKHIIDMTVQQLRDQYCRDKNKNILSEMDKPSRFYQIFRKYMTVVKGAFSNKDLLEPLLDQLLNHFPENELPELFEMYLEWDDTIRLIMDSMPQEHKLITELTDEFQNILLTRIRILSDQTLPDQSLLTGWKEEYEISIIMFHDILEQIRENVLSEHYEYRSCHEDIEKKVMQCAYRIHHGWA